MSARRIGLILVLASCCGIGGCGGCGNSGKRGGKFIYGPEDVGLPAAKEPESAAPAAAKPPPALNGPPAAPSAAKVSTATPAPPAAPPPPARPTDFAQWTQADYLSAKMERDPRLSQAVQYLASQRPGDAGAAQILAAVLAHTDSAYRPRGGRAGNDPTMVRLVVGALSTNASAPARATLGQVLSGEFPTDDDPTAFAATLEALAGKPSPAGDDVLVDLIRQPQSWPGATSAGFRSGPPLGPRLLAALRPIASESLRLRLADAAATGYLPPAAANGLRDMLGDPIPANLGAQARFYTSRNLSQTTRARLEDSFLTVGTEAMRRLLRVQGRSRSTANTPNSAANTPNITAAEALLADPQLVQRVNQYLWDEATLAILRERLLTVESLTEVDDVRVVALALTVPRNAIRATVRETLRDNWGMGPATLQARLDAGTWYPEPGALLLVGDLYRLGAKQGKKKRHTTTTMKQMVQAADEGLRLNFEWAKFGQAVISDYCHSLHILAAQNGVGAGDSNERTAAGRAAASEDTNIEPATAISDLPIALPPKAKLICRFDLRWPRDATAQGGSQADATELHYVRLQETTNSFETIPAYFRAHLSSPQGTAFENGKKYWLDSHMRSPTVGNKIGVDVILTRTNRAASESVALREERVTIEILTVEIRDASPID